MTQDVLDINELKEKIQNFAIERDWEQFHTPKNLAMALNVEASELLEIFQWLTPEQSQKLVEDPKKMKDIQDEIADIVVYAIRISSILDINIKTAITEKMKQNAQKYPVDKAKGNAKKYSEL